MLVTPVVLLSESCRHFGNRTQARECVGLYNLLLDTVSHSKSSDDCNEGLVLIKEEYAGVLVQILPSECCALDPGELF